MRLVGAEKSEKLVSDREPIQPVYYFASWAPASPRFANTRIVLDTFLTTGTIFDATIEYHLL